MRKIISIIFIFIFILSFIQMCCIPQFKGEIEPAFSPNVVLEDITENTTVSQTNFTYKKDHKDTLEDLKNNITNLVGDRINSFSLIYYEIVSHDAIEINPDNYYKPASTFKVPLNMYLYDEAFANEIDIDGSMTYYSGDYEEGSGVLQDDKIDMLNDPIKLKTLSEYSIVYSDNIATNMLIRYLGYNNVLSYMEEVSGIPITDCNYVTPQMMLPILLKLYTNPNKNPYYDTVINYMKNTIFHDRIDALIPQNIVAHKIGDFESYANDIGIVYTGKPYIIIFYTDGFEYETLAEISKMIYDFNIEE